MSVTMPRIVLLAGLVSMSSLWSTSSWALGLGEIHLNSGLNEPLNADIDIIAATPEELTALRASMAPREAFTRYGIDRPPFLSTVSFKVGKSKDGHDVLIVRSTDSVPEPFVTFLVDVNWARGHLMREYTVLLDPPVFTPNSAQAPTAVAGAESGATERSGTVTRAAPATAANTTDNGSSPAESTAPATSPAAASASATASGAPGTYRVRRGDSLSRITDRLVGADHRGARQAIRQDGCRLLVVVMPRLLSVWANLVR